MASHNDWLATLRADYDRRTVESEGLTPTRRFSTGSQDEAAFAPAPAAAYEEPHYPSYGGAIPSYGGAYAGGYDEYDEYSEGPVYRSLNIAALTVSNESERPVYPGAPAAHIVEETSSREAMDAAWLASNPPLLCRQQARSAFADPSGWRPGMLTSREA
jgi:hypothetical protein